MPLLLRKIRKARWYTDRPAWLSKRELQADPLGDIATQSNKLSLWQVNDDRSNLNDVIAALAATANTISNFDYILFDAGIISKLSFKIEKSAAITPYTQANQEWHHDVIELSAQKLIKLAKILLSRLKTGRLKTERKGWQEVLALLSHAVASGQIDWEKLESNLRPEELNKIKEFIAKKSESPST